MIIHRLIGQHLKTRDNENFYSLQAQDSIRWMEQSGINLGSGGTTVLDLGCGHGVFGAELLKRGCKVTFADEENQLLPELACASFQKINLDKDNVAALGKFDLVICSNVLEHLSKPNEFLESVHQILASDGTLYLSWTNWLSPWGGHEFSPFHYLGSTRGHLIYDKIIKKPRKHTPFENLYPTYIGTTLEAIEQNGLLRVLRVAPRYYTEFGFLMRLPLLREFLAWNCAMLVQRNGE